MLWFRNEWSSTGPRAFDLSAEPPVQRSPIEVSDAVTTALERRFLAFLSQLPGSESLDVLLNSQAYIGERRADYLLFDRKLILEVKSLEVDTSHKAEAELDRHRNRPDFPVFYGE